MAVKFPVQKNDYERVLLTEVLPYELPILFSNAKFYTFAKQLPTLSPPIFVKQFLEPRNRMTIPYEYNIWQGNRNRRTLSLIHPAWQLKFIDLYRDYSELIISLCGRSRFSLRYPSRIASYYFERGFAAESDELNTGAADQEPEAFGDQPTHAASYFYYARYAQLYRFVDSADYLSLEARLPKLVKFDLKRCFSSIYTHSLAWAIKNKEFGKDNRTATSFEGAFDELMRGANYQETHGIVIGPEISRIFAEILLQRVDRDIELEIEARGIFLNDYEIRRYVDDYFVFTRDARIGERIYEIAQEKLKEYKLFVNENKTEVLSAPLVTSQSIAKAEVQALLQSSVLSWLNALKKSLKEGAEVALDPSLRLQLQTPYKLAARVMRDLKIGIKKGDATFDVVTSYALGSVTQSLYRLRKAVGSAQIPEDVRPEFQNILTATVEIAFFLYSMDFRVRTTYFISQLMIIVAELAKSDPQLRMFLVGSMRAHVNQIMFARPAEHRGGLEVLNLLIALRHLMPEELFLEKELVSILGGDGSDQEQLVDKFGYFEFVVMLYYIQDDPRYASLKSELIAGCSRFFKRKNVAQSSQHMLLLIDLLACPHLTVQQRRDICSVAFSSVMRRTAAPVELDTVINFCRQHLGFFSWRAGPLLEKLLKKKQLNTPY